MRSDTKTKRNEAIVKHFEESGNKAETSRVFNITRQRVWAIVKNGDKSL